MNAPSIPAALRMSARLQPNETALTFINYDKDWEGVPESLTWLQLYRRTLNVARELKHSASPGDRVVISAPQSMDYILAFLGALEAGLIAVPLSVPLGGATDDRFDAVLVDAAPVAVLTTSAAVNDVNQHVKAQPGAFTPAVIEIDSLDLNAQSGSGSATHPSTAYLQYTSGSTRTPAGVIMTHQNVQANVGQLIPHLFADSDGVGPADTTLVSWLPFYHDMGLFVGICTPIVMGWRAVLTGPPSFLQRPARWLHMLASNPTACSAAPNFAFDLAARKTTDEDLAGHDLANVHTILSGSERVQPATMKRFADRFARFNFPPKAIRPAYGLAEATVYVASSAAGKPPELLEFDADKLADGQAILSPGGTPLVSYLLPPSPLVRIVDADTRTQCPDGTVGEIWVYGDNVASGYWQKPNENGNTFGATILNPPQGTPEGPWLRTGDSGFLIDGKMFIIGRIKDLLIVYGRNHSPDDIESTINAITRSRCVAIAVPDDRNSNEKLVTIIELKPRADADEDPKAWLESIKGEIVSAISAAHGLSVADLVLVPPGSIPTTTSGKVRRRACVEQYRHHQFARIDA